MDVWEDGYACNGGSTYYEAALKLHNDRTVRLRWRGARDRSVREVIFAVGGDLWIKQWLSNDAAFTVTVRLVATLSLEVGETLKADTTRGWFSRSPIVGLDGLAADECAALTDLVNGTMAKLVVMRGGDPSKFVTAGPPVSRETSADPFTLTLPE